MTEERRIKLSTKEYLQQVYRISQKVRRLRHRREDLRNDLYSLGSPAGSMDADKVQTSMSGDSMLRLIAKVDLLERDIVRELEVLENRKSVIVAQIEELSDDRYKTLLFERYVLLRSWDQIADDMGYQLKWVYDLHGQALLEFAAHHNLRECNRKTDVLLC